MSEPGMTPAAAHHMAGRARLRAAIVSLVVATILFAVKFQAWVLTDSAAVLSDALESIVNIVAAALAAFSVWYSSQPADEDHPYGHGKVEDFSAGVEGALIIVAAAAILIAAVPRFFGGPPLQSLDRGAILLGFASVANAVLGVYLLRQGRRHRSRALEADGKHVLTDVYSSVGVIVGVGLVALTGWSWLDPLIACLIAGHILVSGFHLIRESVGRLMDEADDDALEALTARLVEVRRPYWIDVHELRAWWSGDLLHVDVHLALPRFWSIAQSHDAADALEDDLQPAIGGTASVVVHVDPCRDSWCSICSVEDCPIRVREKTEDTEWDRAHVVRIVPPPRPATAPQ